MEKYLTSYPRTDTFSVRVGKDVINWKYEPIVNSIVCHGSNVSLAYRLDSSLPESIESQRLQLDPQVFLVSSINVDLTNHSYSRTDDAPYYWKLMGDWVEWFVDRIKDIAGNDDVEMISRGGLITPKMISWELSLGDKQGIPKKERNHG